jgi:hypothetical protein
MLGEPLRAPFGRARVGLFAVRCRSYLRRPSVGLVRLRRRYYPSRKNALPQIG